MLTSPSPIKSMSRAPFDGAATSQVRTPLGNNRYARLDDLLDPGSSRRTYNSDMESRVDISPPDAVERLAKGWPGMTAELVQASSDERTEYRFRAPVHLLAVFENASRHDGESFVEGLPRSTLRSLTRKLTFVPAGHQYHEWLQPRVPTRLMYIYIDPAKLEMYSGPETTNMSAAPRLLFEDAALWESAVKLKRSMADTTLESQLYVDAIGVVLLHELVRFHRRTPGHDAQVRGGLASRQRRIVCAYIEEHLDEQISLAALARLADLSPYHFCRAFKQSFGVAPHRYHTDRRIERAMAMLAKGGLSVTEIGFAVGYGDTSSFCTAFRKTSGLTPRAYQRSLQ